MLTVREYASRHGLTARRITGLCKAGKIAGAVKKDSRWMIPENATLPPDGRVKKTGQNKDKHVAKLPVGISDFKEAVSRYYYIDKTLMIKDILDSGSKVILYTRPRRFGKTLNAQMLKTFFEKSTEDTSRYFRNLAIWKEGKVYTQHQGKYPVIYLTFKDIVFDNWDMTLKAIGQLIRKEALRHSELDDPAFFNSYYSELYRKLADGTYDELDLSGALQNLSYMLSLKHGRKAVIIIDEYDTPIQQGYFHGFYDEAASFIRNLFSGGFKDNSSLAYGFLTGIMRTAKESIFSGMNNLSESSVLDDIGSPYFGFTHEEVRKLLSDFGALDKFDEICSWYDGYHFGKEMIFNPWSIARCSSSGFETGSYWERTGSNEIISAMLQNPNARIYDSLMRLMEGETITASLNTAVVYPEIGRNPDLLFSFLLMTGYLTSISVLDKEISRYELAIPNKEVSIVYRNEIMEMFSPMLQSVTGTTLHDALISGDNKLLQATIRDILMNSVSFFDSAREDFFHALMLGLLVAFPDWKISSNRETGLGRADILMIPKRTGIPGIILEFKAEKSADDGKLHEISEKALAQILSRKYDAALSDTECFAFGIAFSGKKAAVSSRIIR